MTREEDDDMLLCPRRPVEICIDKEGKETPLYSEFAVKKITRFAKCLRERCVLHNECFRKD